MRAVPELSWQPALLAAGEPAFDPSFSTLARRHLDESAWVDYAPGWLEGSDTLFTELVERAEWDQPVVPMYGREVIQPRLSARWRQMEVPIMDAMRAALSTRYGVAFDSGGLNLYRDGRDSVAWHGDRIAKEVVDPVVAILSLGSPRRFLLRPKGGGRSIAYELRGGDLLVTGGTCQRTWQHSVPKVREAGPRMSVTFRHGGYRE